MAFWPVTTDLLAVGLAIQKHVIERIVVFRPMQSTCSRGELQTWCAHGVHTMHILRLYQEPAHPVRRVMLALKQKN